MHYLLKKNKISDISVFMEQLIGAFNKTPYKGHLIDIVKYILIEHKEKHDAMPTKNTLNRLSNMIKIFIRESTLVEALDALVDEPDLSLNKKACEFMNILLQLCKNDPDNSLSIEAHQNILNHLIQSRKFEEMFVKIQKVFESCMIPPDTGSFRWLSVAAASSRCGTRSHPPRRDTLTQRRSLGPELKTKQSPPISLPLDPCSLFPALANEILLLLS